MSDAGWSPLGNDGAHRYESAALSVYWPEAEFGILIARWPVLTAEVGATWDEHRQLVERHCSAVERAGLPVQQLPGDVKGFADHLTALEVATPGKDELDAYPDLRTVTKPLVSWPPARTAPCWCGSRRKYKQCCRRHGLGTLD
jgi:uncharacterized protein YecA (UPF0149 family)